MTARPLPHFKRKLQAVAKSLYLEHGWELPRGFLDKEQRDRGSFDLAHWQQCKRMGRDPKALKEAVQTCWAASNSRKSFESALEAKGLFLARGDRRAHVAVTYEGEVLSLSRTTGQKTKAIAARLGEPETWRSVEETKQHIAGVVAPRLRHLLQENERGGREAMQPLNARRAAVRTRHRDRRLALDAAQRQRSETEGRARAARLRRGVAGLWDRLTGKRAATLRANETEALAGRTRDRDERGELVRDQLAERRGLQSEIVAMRGRFAARAEELHSDLARQGASAEPTEQSLSDHFDRASGADSVAAFPRILRGRTAERSRNERAGPEL